MKKLYTQPVAEVIEVRAEDIIRTSGLTDMVGGKTATPLKGEPLKYNLIKDSLV